MNEHLLVGEPTYPGARHVKRSDTLLFLGVVAVAFAVGFGVFSIFFDTFRPAAMKDWVIVKGIIAIPKGFSVGKMPATAWDLGLSVPFAVSWLASKIAFGISFLLFLLLLGACSAPFLGLVAALIYIPWRFYFRSKLKISPMPELGPRRDYYD